MIKFLKTPRGMERILRLMSKQKDPARLRFIYPWKLLGNLGDDMDGEDLMGYSSRRSVAQRIVDELNSEYGAEVMKGGYLALRRWTADDVAANPCLQHLDHRTDTPAPFGMD